MFSSWLNQVHCGDALSLMRQMPEEWIDCTVTSPPYYQQRVYSVAEELVPGSEIGQEESASQYVARLQQVFAECLRVTKKTGALWVVLGDKFVDGELQGLPWRVALAIQETGWRLRCDVIWHKPNAMPSAAKTRPTIDHEYLFFFTRSKDYFYDADAIREPHVTFSSQSRMRGGRKHFGQRGGTPEQGKNAGNANLHLGRWDQAFHPLGRNKRSVWSIPLSKCREAHFAVFPDSLVETCLAATCPPAGIVLDPFLGSGTTALVAARSGRTFVGLELVSSYCQMARRRLLDKVPSAPNQLPLEFEP